MLASTTQDIPSIEARLACIETVLVRVHAVLGNVSKAGNIHGWESQLEELYGLSGDACIAAFSLHAIDLEIDGSAVPQRRDAAGQRGAAR